MNSQFRMSPGQMSDLIVHTALGTHEVQAVFPPHIVPMAQKVLDRRVEGLLTLSSVWVDLLPVGIRVMQAAHEDITVTIHSRKRGGLFNHRWEWKMRIIGRHADIIKFVYALDSFFPKITRRPFLPQDIRYTHGFEKNLCQSFLLELKRAGYGESDEFVYPDTQQYRAAGT